MDALTSGAQNMTRFGRSVLREPRYVRSPTPGSNRAAGLSGRGPDLRIVVLDGAGLVEVGSHAERMANGSQYSESCEIRATAYP